MTRPCILAIDQGTTGSTCIIADRELRILGKANQEFPQHFPKPGWVEHNPEELWGSVQHALREAIDRAGVKPEDIAAIGKLAALYEEGGKIPELLSLRRHELGLAEDGERKLDLRLEVAIHQRHLELVLEVGHGSQPANDRACPDVSRVLDDKPVELLYAHAIEVTQHALQHLEALFTTERTRFRHVTRHCDHHLVEQRKTPMHQIEVAVGHGIEAGREERDPRLAPQSTHR